MNLDRRDFFKLIGIGSAVFVLGPRNFVSAMDKPGQDDFSFVQMSDSHWGFNDRR